MVLSLTARGLTTGEVSAHFAEVYGAQISKDTVSAITDTVVEEMTEWRNRPLDRVYPVIFVDRDHGEDPGRAGHQPAGVCGDRRHHRRRA